jgi:microcystin-dependent protein/Tfp pilus assembly protein FimT
MTQKKVNRWDESKKRVKRFPFLNRMRFLQKMKQLFLRSSFRQDEQGSTLVETILVLIVMTLIATTAFRFWSGHVRHQQNRVIAEQVKDIARASQGYIVHHHRTLEQQAYPYSHFISMETLQGEGWISPAFVNRNIYGQLYGVLVRRLHDHHLEALVISYDGEAIPAKSGHEIAAAIGAAGGFVAQGNTVQGALAGWHLSLDNYQRPAHVPTAGHLAVLLFFNRGNLVSHYLHRYAVEGYPEANRMETAIDMNGQNIRGAREVSTQTLRLGEQALAEAQAQTLNRLHHIQCPLGQSLTRNANGTFSCVAPIVPVAVPAGLIAAFNATQCPQGWTAFNAAAGRVLLGSGTLGIDQYAVGNTGGEARHRLTIPEIPSHTHSYLIGSGETSDGIRLPARAQNSASPRRAGTTDAAGGSQPHENRPPYYVVKYCRKD